MTTTRLDSLRKFAQETAKKGLNTQALLQRYRTLLTQQLQSIFGQVPDFALDFADNMMPIEFLNNKIDKVGLKAILNIKMDGAQVRPVLDQIETALKTILQPTQVEARNGTAVFKYEVLANGNLLTGEIKTTASIKE